MSTYFKTITRALDFLPINSIKNGGITGTGALTGGVGGALGKAAGGGIGAAAWKLNGASANFGLGSYRNYRGW